MDLGIDISAATMKEYALAQGIEKSYSAMTQGEKMMLRYKYLMEQTSMQQGDFSRTSLSLANSLRILRAYASEVATQIGAGLGAAIRHVVVWLNGLMKHVLKAAQAFAIFMQTIFGKYKGGASGVNLDGALLDADDSMSDLADSAGDATSGIGDADDAAKKLKKDLAVLPFDELNQLAKDQEQASSGKGGTGGGGVGGIGDIGDFGEGLFGDAIDGIEGKLSELQSFVDQWAQKIKKAFEAKDWEGLGKAIAWGLNKGIDALYKVLDPVKAKKKIDPFITAFVKTVNSLVGAIKWNTLGRAIGRGVNILVDAMNGLINPKTGIDFVQIGKSFASGLNGIVDEVNFKALGNLIGNKFMITWNTLAGFAKNFDWKGIGQALGKTINGINDAIEWSTVTDALATSLNGAFDALKEFTKTVEWRNVATNIANGINKAVKEFKWSENGKALNDFLTNLVNALVTVAEKTDWYKLGKGIGDFLSQIKWGEILTKAAKAFIIAFTGLLEGFANTPAGAFVTALGSALAVVKVAGAIDKFTSNIATTLTGQESVGVITKAIQDLFSSSSSGAAAGLAGITSAVAPIALAVAGVTALIGFAELEGQKAERDLTGEFTNIKQDAEDLNERIDKLKENTTSTIETAKKNAAADARLAEPFIQAIEELTKKANLSSDEMDLLHEAVDRLNEIYPDLKVEINKTTGELSMGVEQIREYCNNLKNIAIAEVYMGKAKEAAVQLVEADEGLATAQKKYNALVGQHRDLELTRDKVMRNSVNGYIELNGKTVEAQSVLDGLNQQLEDNEEKQVVAKAALDEYSQAHTNAEGVLNHFMTQYQTYATTVSTASEEASTKAQKSFNDVVTGAQTATEEATTKGEKIPKNLADGISNAQSDATDMLSTVIKTMQNQIPDADFASQGVYIPRGIAKGIKDEMSVTSDAMKDLSNALMSTFKTENGINSPATEYTAQSKFIPEGIKKGILDNKSQAISAMTTLISGLLTEFKNKALGAGGLSTQMNKGGKTVTSEFIKGLKDLGGFKASTFYDNMFSDVWKKLDKIASDFYKKGQSISQQFANGISSVKIPYPDITVSSWTPWEIDTGTEKINFSIPHFVADWRKYAKGGLFTKPLPGILGDAGDEAALPLENRRTMNRIANAIVDNADGNLGISKQDIVDAVVYAMAANSQNQAPINVTATLYTEDNEVLARAVERGNRSRDMRYNPTTAY